MRSFGALLDAFFSSSVRRQLVWGVALVHAAMMTLFVMDLSVRQHEFLTDSQVDQAKYLAETLSVTAITPMLSSDLSGLQELVMAVAKYPGVLHVMAIHPNGKILAHSDPAHLGQYVLDAPTFSVALASPVQILSQTDALVDVVTPVTANAQRLGWVRVGVGQSNAAARLESITRSGFLYTTLAIGVGVVLAWILARRLTRRLSDLALLADAVRMGSVERRADIRGTDELSHLAQAFNFMLDALESRMRIERKLQTELNAEKELAQVTLASIGDAVITTDERAHITFMNAVAENLTGWCSDDVRGRLLADIFQLQDPVTRQSQPEPVARVLALAATQTAFSPGGQDSAWPEAAVPGEGLLVSRSGHEAIVESTVSPIFAPDGEVLGCVLVFRDVSDKHKIQDRLQWQAGHDALTGLPNRVVLADRFARALERARRQRTQLAVCMLDLDQFKPVNDTYGHEVGDELLVQTAQRLTAELRGLDTLCRLGGDEFVLLFEDLEDSATLSGALLRLLSLLAEPFEIAGHRIRVSASIGMTVFPDDDADADTLLRHADQAMYVAKQSGRNRYHQFDVSQDRQMQSTRQTVERVREALRDGELCLHYQPKVNLRTGEVVGFEALLRWQHPQEGLVPPLRFLPMVEQTDVIVDIGEWVTDQALQQMSDWGKLGHLWPVSVNIAARQFQRGDFLERLKGMLARHTDVSPTLLEFEILESVALGDIRAMRSLMTQCGQLGIAFSLDDFGTGYSSLSYLKHLPVQTLKIDQSFVRNMRDDKDDLALVGAVINIAQLFGRQVAAEGVETHSQGQQLLALGCETVQGYGIARPMPPDAVPTWVAGYLSDRGVAR